MDTNDTLMRLNAKLQSLKQDRDVLNGDVLRERSIAAQKSAELARLHAEFELMKNRMNEKEHVLNQYNVTINETELAQAKLQVNSDRLLSALEKESTNLKSRINY